MASTEPLSQQSTQASKELLQDFNSDDEDEKEFKEAFGADGGALPVSARELLKREKLRLKLEEEKLRKEEELLEKKNKEDKKTNKENLKKEKERLKREKEEVLRKVKDAVKKETQRQRRLSHDNFKEVQDINDGWMKMRGALKNWHLRWFVLRPGKLIYYDDELDKDCEGIILLKGCQVVERPTKKEGFCFKIFHPRKKAIYSAKGLKGETLPAALIPLTADHCILRVNTEEERNRWIRAIEESFRIAKEIRRNKRKQKDLLYNMYSVNANGNGSAAEDDSRDVSEQEDSDDDEDYMPGEGVAVTRKGSSGSTSNLLSSSPINLRTSMTQMSASSSPLVGSPSNSITIGATNPNNHNSLQNVQLIVPKKISPRVKKTPAKKRTTYVEAPDEGIFADDSGNAQEEELAQDSKSIIFALLKQVKIGMDLSRVTLPTFILEPRSMLEKLSDFLTHAELLADVAKQEDPLQRMVAFVKWYISGYYLKPKGVKKPYNPLLGEIFRCSWQHNSGSTTYLVCEQVSHHPPVSAFYASNRREGFVINGSILYRSRFNGSSAGTILDGFATIYITPFNEEYEITFPSVYAKGFLFGTLMMELAGSCTVNCKQSGYRAEIEFKQKPLIGGEYNALNAKIRKGKETVYTISGKWDELTEITNCETKQTDPLWNPTPEIRKSRLVKRKPIATEMLEFESDRLWEKVSQAIRVDDQEVATQEKFKLEQAQREAAKFRQEHNVAYSPKLFMKDSNGVWLYKYFNRSNWDAKSEIEEIETNGGIIYSLKENESGSEASEDEEDVDIKADEVQMVTVSSVQHQKDIQNNLEAPHGLALRSSAPIPQLPPRSNSNTQSLESRIFKLEKDFLMLQHKYNSLADQKATKKSWFNLWSVLFFGLLLYVLWVSLMKQPVAPATLL